MWDGMFKPYFVKGTLTDHFKIVDVERSLLYVKVRVEFDKTPGRIYLYEIPVEEWDGKKDTVARFIQE